MADISEETHIIRFAHDICRKFSAAILNFLMSAVMLDITICGSQYPSWCASRQSIKFSPEIRLDYANSQKKSAILDFRFRMTSHSDGSSTVGSGVLENMGIAVGISFVGHS
jgi:hypothetical protein